MKRFYDLLLFAESSLENPDVPPVEFFIIVNFFLFFFVESKLKSRILIFDFSRVTLFCSFLLGAFIESFFV